MEMEKNRGLENPKCYGGEREYGREIRIDGYFSDKGEAVGGLSEVYYRKSDPNGPPRKDLMEYAQLAIDSYNKTKTKTKTAPQCYSYSVVDIIRAEKYRVAGYSYFIDFTAKKQGDYADDDDDAITTFRARIWRKVARQGSHVQSVGPITQEEAASKHIRDTTFWP